jgi:beta-aspartyl-peptidase (threonine type)
MTNKRWGRVGDSPIIGAGTYATASCAVSATGHGEFFIRANVAHDICARVEYLRENIDTAGKAVIHQKLRQMGGEGGVIIIDNKGNVSLPFNTTGMYRASINNAGTKQIAIFTE